jgi:hypothetical protein
MKFTVKTFVTERALFLKQCYLFIYLFIFCDGGGDGIAQNIPTTNAYVVFISIKFPLVFNMFAVDDFKPTQTR